MNNMEIPRAAPLLLLLLGLASPASALSASSPLVRARVAAATAPAVHASPLLRLSAGTRAAPALGSGWARGLDAPLDAGRVGPARFRIVVDFAFLSDRFGPIRQSPHAVGSCARRRSEAEVRPSSS